MLVDSIRTHRRSLLLAGAIVAVLLLVWSEPALAQCAMCKESLANSTEGAAAVKQFNLGILVLLIPPVAMFAGIFGMIYRSARSQSDE